MCVRRRQITLLLTKGVDATSELLDILPHLVRSAAVESRKMLKENVCASWPMWYTPATPQRPAKVTVAAPDTGLIGISPKKG